MDDVEDLGACCVCRKVGRSVRNVIMVPRLAPVPGRGWGCFVCHLPQNGALAVVCDACISHCKMSDLKDVCYDYPATKQRRPFSSLSEELFGHDMILHEKDDARRAH